MPKAAQHRAAIFTLCVFSGAIEDMVEFTMQHWKQIGISDEDVAELAARKQCHIGTAWHVYQGLKRSPQSEALQR